MGRSKLKTLKETTLNTFFEISSKLQLSNQFVYNDNKGIVNWNNGSQIILKDLFFYPSDREFDSLGSLEITGGFIDEVSQLVKKAWDIAGSRCRYKLEEFDKIPKLLGSCNPSKGWVYKNYYAKHKAGVLEPTKAFIQALPTDNPYLPESYLQRLLALDDNSKQRLYYGNWEYDDDPSALIDFQKLSDIWTNDFVDSGEMYMSADVARLGKDSTVIGVWDGWRLTEIKKYDKLRTTEVSNIIRVLAKKHRIPISNIIVDEDGLGGGVVDQLRCNGFVNNSKPIETETGQEENFNNLKSQCYFRLADKINSSLLYICETEYADDIQEELEQVRQHNMDKDGKRAILPKDKVKENIGRSPDFSDMMAMRVWFELGHKWKFSIN